jgi:protein required for attachment to host cells
MMPHNALIVVADGTGARFFRNKGQGVSVSLVADGELKPSDLLSEGPAGNRPTSSSKKETDEATFAKQLAQDLYRRVHAGSATDIVLIADKQTLGQMRPALHKEVRKRLLREIGKTLTKASVADIQKALT